MARDRSQSYSPRRRNRTPPPRDRKRHDEAGHRDRRDLRSAGPSGLLVRNLSSSVRPDDLRIPFERYGTVTDVYLPKDFLSGKQRGFGFVKFHHACDAAEAKHQLNNSIIGGRELKIVYAEENRKTPLQMSTIMRPRERRYGGRISRRTPSRSPRRQYHSSSRSPSPVRDRKYRDYDRSPVHSRSVSQSPPHDHRRSHRRSPSPRTNCRTRAEVSRNSRGTVRTPSGSRSRSYSS